MDVIDRCYFGAMFFLVGLLVLVFITAAVSRVIKEEEVEHNPVHFYIKENEFLRNELMECNKKRPIVFETIDINTL